MNMLFEECTELYPAEFCEASTSCSSEIVYQGLAIDTCALEGMDTAVCVESPKSIKLQRTGRKRTEGSQLLSGVVTDKLKPLKVEYKRCQFIRLSKKMIRELSGFKFSKKFLREYGVTNKKNLGLLWRLQKIYLNNKESFDSFKGTDSGPVTDGVSKLKRGTATQPKARSFNNQFCRNFYTPKSVREFHAVLVELIYGRSDEVDPAVLCRKFREFCCFDSKHTKMCVEKWTNVLKYMKTTMIESLGLDPVSTDEFPTSEAVRTPELFFTPESDWDAAIETPSASEGSMATSFHITEDNEEFDVDEYLTS